MNNVTGKINYYSLKLTGDQTRSMQGENLTRNNLAPLKNIYSKSNSKANHIYIYI